MSAAYIMVTEYIVVQDATVGVTLDNEKVTLTEGSGSLSLLSVDIWHERASALGFVNFDTLHEKADLVGVLC